LQSRIIIKKNTKNKNMSKEMPFDIVISTKYKI